MDIKELGSFGERIACEYLVKKGYKILDKNYRIKFGEIDIIAKKRWKLFRKNDKTIHFIEVKSLLAYSNNGRSSTIRVQEFFPEEKVDWKKQRKLIRLSQIWLESKKLPAETPYQIDIIGISADKGKRMAKLHFFKNVFEDN